MNALSLLPGVASRTILTPRLRTHVLTAGAETGIPVVLVHGNVSSALFYEELLAALPAGYWGIAPDLRGFGDSETRPVDAARGLRDWSDDLDEVLGFMGINARRPAHLVGWSMGGGIIMQYAIDHADRVASLTLISPLSPYGFGGTRDAQGTLTYPDRAGSGGGTANPDFIKALAAGDRGADSPNSPRNVMNAFYFKPPFKAAPEREEVFVTSMLTTKTGDGNYPGNLTPSEHWPNVAPGPLGGNNAMAPGYCDLSGFAQINPHPPVLWVRGADDQIVSDTSFFDLGTLGQLGFVPGWPGAEIFPPQPMLSQTRHVLDAYAANGGAYREVVFPDCGHSPHIEKPAEFQAHFFAHIGTH